MVIDELIVIENGINKNIDSADNKPIDCIKVNNVSYHFAKETEVIGIDKLTCENAVDEPIADMKVYGNSGGVGDLSENILPINYKTTTSNGVTMTVNEDGSITASGTPTGYVAVVLYNGELLATKSGAITISLAGDFVNTNVIVTLQDADKKQLGTVVVYKSSPKTITYSDYEGLTYMVIAYRRASNNIAMSGTGYIMVVAGTEARQFVPYGKYNIPIQHSGKNLIDYTKAQPRNTSQSITIDKENNAVIWSGNYYFDVPVNIKAGNTIKLSYESDYAGNWTIGFEDGTYSGNIRLVDDYTLTKNMTSIRIYKITPATEVENMVFKNIQLEYGQIATDYERYIEPQTINANLDKQLTETTDYVDILNIETFDGTNIFDIQTKITPSQSKITYWKQI